MREYDTERYTVYRPSERRYPGSNEELNAVIDDLVLGVKEEARPRYLVVDEANRSLPNQKDPGEGAADLIDFNRHFGVSLLAISRRPSQLNTDLENLANHTFCFGLKGKNDRRAYSQIHEDLPEALDSKPEYAPVYVSGAGDLEVFRPVDYLGETPTI
jgi:DNA helicase HerA-like ATPase